MEKERVFALCLVTLILTLMVVGAACTSKVSNNSTSKPVTQTSENATMKTTPNATNVSHGAPLTVAEGQEFTITLRTNSSTGYYWEPHFNSNALSLTSRTFISDPNPYNLVGVPGSELFTFRSLAKGTTAITFDNINPSQVITAQMVCAVTVT